MYSRLDSLFTARLRHAEPLDTRQAIRRHEDQGGRSPRDEREKEDGAASDLWEDRTTVSVRALKAFLEQLVAGTGGADAAKGEAVGISQAAAEAAPQRRGSEQSEQAAKAAQAYERTYRATHADSLPPSATPSAPAVELTPEETRIIHALIKDLSTLAAQNVETLTLEKSESFLQSLVGAVKEYNLSQLSS